MLQTLIGVASETGDGMDFLQLYERISGTHKCTGVLARNPELSKKSHHLVVTSDYHNPRSYISTEDNSRDESRILVTQINPICK